MCCHAMTKYTHFPSLSHRIPLTANVFPLAQRNQNFYSLIEIQRMVLFASPSGRDWLLDSASPLWLLCYYPPKHFCHCNCPEKLKLKKA